MLKHLPPVATPLSLPNLWRFPGVERPYNSFKEALKSYLNSPHIFLASSGRTALYFLLHALARAQPARKVVLLPAYTCPALVNVIVKAGLTPRFVDISADDFEFDPRQLLENLSSKSLALICVHPFGIPLDVSRYAQMAHAVGAYLIEDAAQALGARWQGQSVGLTGDFGLFSLGPGKPLSTGGGGILCTQSQRKAGLLESSWREIRPSSTVHSIFSVGRYLAFSAICHPRAWWWASHLKINQIGTHPSSWNFSLRQLSLAQAQIGTVQLSQLDKNNRERRQKAAWLIENLKEAPNIRCLPTAAGNSDPVYLRLPIIFNSQAACNRVYTAGQNANIGVGRMYQKTLPQLFPRFATALYPGAQHIADCLLTLPTHHFMSQPDLMRLKELIRMTP